VILHGRSSTALRRAVIVGAAALVPVLAGCEAGNNAPTSQWHQPTPGASTVLPSGPAGQLAIQNVFALGAAGDRSLPAGSSAGLYLALVNTGPADQLVSASAPGTASSVRLPGNGVRLPRNQAVLFTGPAPRLILDHLTRRLMAGVDIRVTLNFQNAGSVTLSIPVMPRVDYYATFSPAPAIPTATPKASAKPKASGSATATPSATPAASVTPSASATP
jgi:copper(I)-binding protein